MSQQDMDDFFAGVEYVPGSVLPDWRRILKYNTHHAPAGSPHGGEFTSGNSGAYTGEMIGYKPGGAHKETLDFVFGSEHAFETYQRELAGTVTSRAPTKRVQVAIYTALGTEYHGEPAVRVTIKTHFFHTGRGNGQTLVQRDFYRTLTGDLFVDHKNFQVPEGRQGAGIAKAATAVSLEHYDKFGVEHIYTLANISVGAYAWARMGFEPATASWHALQAHILKRAQELLADGMISHDHFDAALKHATSRNPRSLWHIADMRQGDYSVGKHLLLNGPSWDGYFMMKDASTRKRAAHFVSPVHKFNPHHAPAGSSHGGEFTSGEGGSWNPPARVPREFVGDGYENDFKWANFGPGGATFKNVGWTQDQDSSVHDSAVKSAADRILGTPTTAGRVEAIDLINTMTRYLPARYNYAAGVLHVTEALTDKTEVLHITIGAAHPEGANYGITESPHDGEGHLFISRRYFRKPDGLHVMHDTIELHESIAGQGRIKPMYRDLFNQYERLGVKDVGLAANIDVGGYAWARMGFAPTKKSWDVLRAGLDKSLSTTTWEHVKEYLDDPNPTAIWKIADKRVGDRNIGKEVLMRTSWKGYFNMADHESRRRMHHYTGAFHA